MAGENIALAMFEDTESRRDPSIRWLTGQPGDALLFLSAVDRKNLLVPWDVNIAALYANADGVVPYNEFGRHPAQALPAAVTQFKIDSRGVKTRVEVPQTTPYPLFLQYADALKAVNCETVCRTDGAAAEAERLRAIKDEGEIKLYRKLSTITNALIDSLEKNLRDNTIKTESDAALFIEAEARKQDCEGTSFETLAAGPSRSFGIHAFPAYTAAAFGGKGLSILDFGLKYKGYTSDVTMTFARDVSIDQEQQLALMKEAYDFALAMVKPGASARDIALAVDAFYAEHDKTLPHGLGHGVGLEIHEAPFLRSRSETAQILEAGMIFTIEPGVYDPEIGGCRYENDILVTDDGYEVLTNTRIVRL